MFEKICNNLLLDFILSDFQKKSENHLPGYCRLYFYKDNINHLIFNDLQIFY